MKTLVIPIFAFFTTVAYSAEVNLVSAPLGLLANIVSEATGKQYSVTPENNLTISLSATMPNDPLKAHEYFQNYLEELGLDLAETSDGVYVVQKKVIPTIDPVEPEVVLQVEPMETNSDVIEVYRLAGLIEKQSLEILLAEKENMNGVKIIDRGLGDQSVVVIGSLEQHDEIFEILSILSEVRVAQEKSDIGSGQPIVQVEQTVNRVIELNHARSSDVILNIQEVVSGNPKIFDGLSFTSHNPTNQILLSGTQSQIDKIAEMTSAFDRKPRQIFVDAIIAEVSQGTIDKLGIQFSATVGRLTLANVVDLNGAALSGAISNDLYAGLTGGMAAIGQTANTPALGILLNALQTEGQNKILATPSIMATENLPAEIVVGQNVPIITGSTQGEGSSNIIQTISRQDLGTILKITPRINQNNEIQLEINQEVSRLDTSNTGLQDVATTKRQVQTVINALPGETIVLGGLEDEQISNDVQGLPVLSDIPVIGNIFKTTTNNSGRRKLLIFLRTELYNTRDQRAAVIRRLDTSEGN